MSIITSTTQTPEVAIIQADCAAVEGWHIHWVISRRQIEYLLTDIVSLPPNAEQPHLQRAQYLEQSLPVIYLERHFGLVQEDSVQAALRYLVTKYVTGNQTLGRAILQIRHPVRMRKLAFNSTPARHHGISINEHQILGAYTMPENQLLVVPDIFSIVDQVQAVEGVSAIVASELVRP